MRALRWLILIIAIGWGDEYAVIVNKALKIEHPSQENIRQIFLKKRRFIGKIQLVPINQNPTSSIRRSFERDVLHRSRHWLVRYWTMEHYKGCRPPLTLSSDTSVLMFVQKIPGAIGYVNVRHIPKDAKVDLIYTWSTR